MNAIILFYEQQNPLSMDGQAVGPIAIEMCKTHRFPCQCDERNSAWHPSDKNVCLGRTICQNGGPNSKVSKSEVSRELKVMISIVNAFVLIL